MGGGDDLRLLPPARAPCRFDNARALRRVRRDETALDPAMAGEPFLSGTTLRRFVLSRPIPERLIESLRVAPAVPPHEIDAWVRAGGRVSNNGPRSRTRKKFRGAHVTHPPAKLSRRELEAIRLLADGKTHKEAAFALGVSHSIFGALVQTARYRLDRSPTSERAVLVAAARGLVSLPPAQQPSLSPRERQALAMYHAGATKREIARALDVMPDTVGSLLKGCRRKLAVRSTAEAARLVFGT